MDEDRYYGGGLPDRAYQYEGSEEPLDNRLSEKEKQELQKMSERLYDIANNMDGCTELLYKAAEAIDGFLKENKKNE